MSANQNTPTMIKCKRTFKMGNVEYYTAGKEYPICKRNNGTYSITTNMNTVGFIGKGLMIEDIDAYFETSNTPAASIGLKLNINPNKIDRSDTVIMRIQFVKDPISGDCLGGLEYEVPREFAEAIHNACYKSKYSDYEDMDEHATNAERRHIYDTADALNMLESDIILECY